MAPKFNLGAVRGGKTGFVPETHMHLQITHLLDVVVQVLIVVELVLAHKRVHVLFLRAMWCQCQLSVNCQSTVELFGVFLRLSQRTRHAGQWGNGSRSEEVRGNICEPRCES